MRGLIAYDPQPHPPTGAFSAAQGGLRVDASPVINGADSFIICDQRNRGNDDWDSFAVHPPLLWTRRAAPQSFASPKTLAVRAVPVPRKGGPRRARSEEQKPRVHLPMDEQVSKLSEPLVLWIALNSITFRKGRFRLLHTAQPISKHCLKPIGGSRAALCKVVPDVHL